MATSFDALEALLQFHEGVFSADETRSYHHHHAIPVPNPLDPAQPHLIEGDAPNPAAHQQASELETTNESSCTSSSVVTNVPNPLITPSLDRIQVREKEPVTAAASFASLCSNNEFDNNRTPVHSPARPSSTTSCASSILALGEHVQGRSDKLLDALNSMPQRGKKRQNLDEFERQELTRIRNREHAKSTRMRKKARNEELIEIERNYMRLKELETLQFLRRQRLADLIQKPDQENCPHYARLHQLACQEFHEPEFSLSDSVALSSDNSGMMKVSVHGIGLACANPRTLSAVISIEFAPESTVIVSVFLYWSASKGVPPSIGMFPSVSVISFDSQG